MDRDHKIRKIVDRLPYARRAEAIRRLLEKPYLIGHLLARPLHIRRVSKKDMERFPYVDTSA